MTAIGISLFTPVRGQPQEAPRESEERYRALFEDANDAIATSTLEGILTQVNRAAEHLLGWSREEVLGGGLDQLGKRTDDPEDASARSRLKQPNCTSKPWFHS